MSQQWYYSIGGVKSGPIPFINLQELAIAGKLQPTDVVRPENSSAWVSAISVSDLIPKIQSYSVVTNTENHQLINHKPFDPILIATASLLMPPLGQFLIGQNIKSLVLVILSPISLLLAIFVLCGIFGPSIGINLVVFSVFSYCCASCADAFLLAKKIKNGSPIKDWEFFGKWSVYE
jgi:hypothetical protein